jgi:HK97 family phage major capsid protein
MDVKLKTALEGITTTVQGFSGKQKEMQAQLDCLDMQSKGRITGDGGVDLLQKAFEDSSDFARLREIGKGKATVKLDTKTITSTAVGAGTAGVLMPERVGGIVPLAQRRLFMRDLFDRGGRVSGTSAFFLQEATFTNAASPQVEASAKGESVNTFTTKTNPVITIAHWIPASRHSATEC